MNNFIFCVAHIVKFSMNWNPSFLWNIIGFEILRQLLVSIKALLELFLKNDAN